MPKLLTRDCAFTLIWKMIEVKIREKHNIVYEGVRAIERCLHDTDLQVTTGNTVAGLYLLNH